MLHTANIPQHRIASALNSTVYEFDDVIAFSYSSEPAIDHEYPMQSVLLHIHLRPAEAFLLGMTGQSNAELIGQARIIFQSLVFPI